MIERRPDHFLKRRGDMFALTRGVRVVYVTKGGTSNATRRRDTSTSILYIPWISEDIDSIRMMPQSEAARGDVSRVASATRTLSTFYQVVSTPTVE